MIHSKYTVAAVLLIALYFCCTGCRGGKVPPYQDPDGSSSEEKVVAKRFTLSIMNPVDVLSQRLMLEYARRRMEENKNQIRENAILLETIGKRDSARRRRQVARQVSNSDNFED